MKYNFDEPIDRRNTDSKKWRELEGQEGILPMWVADMDFKTPPAVLDDFTKLAQAGMFGYFFIEDEVKEAVVDWVYRRHNWSIDKDWLVLTPGVVTGMNLAVRSFLSPGDQAIIQPPIYPPFYDVLRNNKVGIIENSLLAQEGYRMELGELEDLGPETKAFFLCNPHNPTGRVWTREELEEVARLVLEKDLLLVSDDIHSDIVRMDKTYLPVASLNKEIEARTISFISPSKTFNIAGLNTSVAIIADKDLRERYLEEMENLKIQSTNSFGKLGLKSAYNKGEDWLDQLRAYLDKNIDFVLDYLGEHIGEVGSYRPEGSYVMWLDFSNLSQPLDEIERALLEEGKIRLSKGSFFGAEGKFFRMTIACPRASLEDGLERIRRTVEYLRDK